MSEIEIDRWLCVVCHGGIWTFEQRILAIKRLPVSFVWRRNISSCFYLFFLFPYTSHRKDGRDSLAVLITAFCLWRFQFSMSTMSNPLGVWCSPTLLHRKHPSKESEAHCREFNIRKKTTDSHPMQLHSLHVYQTSPQTHRQADATAHPAEPTVPWITKPPPPGRVWIYLRLHFPVQTRTRAASFRVLCRNWRKKVKVLNGNGFAFSAVPELELSSSCYLEININVAPSGWEEWTDAHCRRQPSVCRVGSWSGLLWRWHTPWVCADKWLRIGRFGARAWSGVSGGDANEI